MLQRLLILAGLLLLAGCQTLHTDYDYNPAYDFSRPLSWQWRAQKVQYSPDDPRYHGSLNEQRIIAAIDDGLLQHGLRAAAAGQSADLQVQARYLLDERQQLMTHYYGGETFVTRHGHLMAAPVYAETHSYRYAIGTLQIDLYDQAGQLVWRGSGSQPMPTSSMPPQQREALIRQTVMKILEGYPPR